MHLSTMSTVREAAALIKTTKSCSSTSGTRRRESFSPEASKRRTTWEKRCRKKLTEGLQWWIRRHQHPYNGTVNSINIKTERKKKEEKKLSRCEFHTHASIKQAIHFCRTHAHTHTHTESHVKGTHSHTCTHTHTHTHTHAHTHTQSHM